MANFNGTLNVNEVMASLYNMIISQEVFSDNIKGTFSSLVERARVDGTLYGDTKLYYATDCLRSVAWGNDAEAANLLALDRPEDPECQKITIDQFRQIRLTVDDYLSKRAWADEGAFSQFNSVILGWVSDTKRVYDSTLYNSYVGTVKAESGKQAITIPLSTISATGEEKNRLEAQTIAQSLADLFVAMEDVSRDYNDYGKLRSYASSDIKVIWNAKYLNKISKLDLPTIFHKDGIIDKFDFSIPARYFGDVKTSGGTTGASNTNIRSLIEKDYNTVAMNNASYDPKKHVFPGDLLPNSTTYLANEAYQENADIICKVVTVLPPYMSAFEVGTSFFNPRSLTTNNYLTFGYNTLEYLKDKPLITVKAA